MNLKKELLQYFTQLNQQLVPVGNFASLYGQSPDSKYRLDFFNALRALNLSERETAKLALAIKLSVNQYDEELSKGFTEQVLMPMLTLILQNQAELPIHKHLSQEELLTVIASGLELTYNL